MDGVINRGAYVRDFDRKLRNKNASIWVTSGLVKTNTKVFILAICSYISFSFLINIISVNTVKVIIFVNSANQQKICICNQYYYNVVRGIVHCVSLDVLLTAPPGSLMGNTFFGLFSGEVERKLKRYVAFELLEL